MSDFQGSVAALQESLRDESIAPVSVDGPTDNASVWRDAFEKTAKLLANGAVPILGKGQRIIPFRPTPDQWQILYLIHSRIMAGKPAWVGIIKPRQIGASTLASAIMHSLTKTIPGMSTLVTAHDRSARDNIWQIYNRFEKRDPEVSDKKYDSRGEMYWEEQDSRLICNIAGEDLGKGGTFQGFHGSEVCNWRDYNGVVNEGVFPAMPPAPTVTLKIFETTGEPNTEFEPVFREAWEEWVGVDFDPLKVDDDSMIPYFSPWYMHPEYKRNLEGQVGNAMIQEILSSLTPDEELVKREMERVAKQRGRAAINVAERIAWRRGKIKSYNNHVVSFKRMYPECIDDAFSIGSNSIFNLEVMAGMRANALNPVFTGEIDLDAQDFSRPVMKPSGSGRFRIYEAPVPGHEYVIGCDPAMDFGAVGDRDQWGGKLHKSETFSVVLDATEGSVVACWQGQSNPEAHAMHLAAMGLHYNTALLVPENNAHGDSLIRRLAEVRYRNIFEEERILNSRVRGKLGITQSAKTRARILDRLQLLFGDCLLSIPDIELLNQMATFVEVRGRMQAVSKRTLDDGVMALAMACDVGSRDRNGINRQWSVKDPTSMKRSLRGYSENRDIMRDAKRSRWKSQHERELDDLWGGVLALSDGERT